MFNVKDRVMICAPARPGPGTVIDVLPANEVPDPSKIDTYYYENISRRQQWPGPYRAIELDRIVVERDGGGYLIVPASAGNTILIRKKAEDDTTR